MNTSEILGDAKDISAGMRSTLARTEQRDMTISRKLVEHTAGTIEALAAEVERLTRELATSDGPVAASDEELGAFYRDHWESVAGPINAIRSGFELGVARSRAERDKAKAEAERLKGELAAERRDRGIWGAGDREGLAVWYDGSEKVVARDADDALAVWAEHNGLRPEQHDAFGDGDVFARVPDEQQITIGLGEEGAEPKAKLTAKCWARINGRGWLCTVNW